MEKILSIIVPAYNVADYIEQCLYSFYAEEIVDQLEVLIIDDGSTDETEQIAQKYCKRYPKIYFLYKKKNGGHGSAINYGIRYAKGKYFKVVDGDDWLNTKELVRLINVLNRVDTDIIATDFLCISDRNKRILCKKNCTKQNGQYGSVCYIEDGTVNDVVKMHALTIKTEILQKNLLKIDENCFYVDSEYMMYPIPFVSTIYFHRGYLYRYRLDRSGQSMDISSMQKRRREHLFVIKQLLNYYKKYREKVTENHKKYMEQCIMQMMENQFQIYISLGWKKGIRTELKSWDQKLKKEFPEIYGLTRKKSIVLLRLSRYQILPIGAIIYKIRRKMRCKNVKSNGQN